ncbi:PREDICTED: uncharacterized protein LOC104607999 isoform X2 [Nelumbo nucifera]|uniref:Uncharacterized protein LOC104607999 isoform X2 n=1 Tax=Nelumbo nucifera TaxID=4432 RepID=A0A1U8B7A2_NELNU|nr:PREDICTED: uncharacterized protein LOC104607999 isoform X2 [Nelumbo nucifera]XP_010272130.1 PREDICTED: uncharacterized protein LOC104607999 isoform X2 [Nelumbo nucifera]
MEVEVEAEKTRLRLAMRTPVVLENSMKMAMLRESKFFKGFITMFIYSNGGSVMKELDINQIPSGTEEVGSAEEEETSLGGGGGEGPHRKKLHLTKELSRLLGEFRTEPDLESCNSFLRR